MSFILEALRRAEAERARGSVPGLHTPSVADLLPADAASGRRGGGFDARPWLLGAGALGALALTAAGAWWLGRGQADTPAPQVADATVPAAVSTPMAPMTPPVVAQGPVAASAPGASPVVAAAPALPGAPATGSAAGPAPGPSPRLSPTPAPMPGWAPPAGPVPGGRSMAERPRTVSPRPEPQAPARPATGATMPEAPATPAPSAGAAPVAPTASPAPPAARPAASAAAPATVPWLADLPALRAQLPALAIAGGMYSDQADQRLVIVNGQVVREGEVVAPGVRLEQIRPRSAVFSFQGQRFAVPM